MEIEKRTIDFIPENERHGSPRDLFTVWFGANINIMSIVTGSILLGFGLNLFWSIVSIMSGTLLGGLFVASHSVQGPRLGIPQMIQSRAQFGVYGAILPMAFVMFIYFGYSVSTTVLVSQTLSGFLNVDKRLVMTIFGLATFLLALYGYEMIHRAQAVLTIISIVIFSAIFFVVLRHPMATGAWDPGTVDPRKILFGIGVTTTFALSNAPYVADYSRYLPSRTSSRSVFINTYAGLCISLTLMEILGAILAVQISNFTGNAGENLARLGGGFSPVIFVLIAYALLCINVFNFYGAFMAVVTTVQPFTANKFSGAARFSVLLVICMIVILLSVLGGGNFQAIFVPFILIMSYALIPWTSINLIDYYVVRKGRYNIDAIFDADGEYGRVNWLAIFSFLFTILAEIPFISSDYYVGSAARALGGIDFAWLVGICVGAGSYYFPMQWRKHSR